MPLVYRERKVRKATLAWMVYLVHRETVARQVNLDRRDQLEMMAGLECLASLAVRFVPTSAINRLGLLGLIVMLAVHVALHSVL